MSQLDLKEVLATIASNAKQVNILTGDHASAPYYEAEKAAKQRSKEDTDVEQATRAAMEYVGRLKDMVTPAWEERYMDLFKRIFSLPQVRLNIGIVGKQQGTTFNRNLVANFVQIMLQEHEIFVPSANPSRMAEKLENNKDHSVKVALGTVPEDKQLKKAVKEIIEESRNNA